MAPAACVLYSLRFDLANLVFTDRYKLLTQTLECREAAQRFFLGYMMSSIPSVVYDAWRIRCLVTQAVSKLRVRPWNGVQFPYPPYFCKFATLLIGKYAC